MVLCLMLLLLLLILLMLLLFAEFLIIEKDGHSTSHAQGI